MIFCSDHGEFLGESGLVGHGSPLRSESVYVPTVFIHPDISHTGREGLMRHIDLYPTILAALDQPIPDHLDGVNLFEYSPKNGYAVSIENLYR
ncbi:MAG: sulfatase-like hydrolase/transferase, partial [Candidatus Paceibacteria bacterium]